MSNKKNNEIFEALHILEKEKNIPTDYLLEKLEKAISTACKNTYNNSNIVVKVDEENSKFEAYLQKTVVEQVSNKGREISLEEARRIKKDSEIGDIIEEKINTKDFGRISVMTARNIIRQAIRDAERGVLTKKFLDNKREVFSAIVDRVDPVTENAIVKFGQTELILPKNEQIKNEILTPGDYIKIYMVDVKEAERGPRAMISRSHPDLVRKLFENEVPEIIDGIVEIKSVAREAGSRTKMSVLSHDENIDPVGTCIGNKGCRVAAVVDELSGEKIDIVEYSEDIGKYVTAALAPASVIKVEVNDAENKQCRATVPDFQLSLAIGNKGQNVRLAAKLTGWKIDIVPESGFYGDDEEDTDEDKENAQDD